MPIPRRSIDRARIERAVAAANYPTLLMVLTQLTGDLNWIQAPYLPARVRGLVDDDAAGMSPESLEKIRSAAVAAVLAWHSGAPAAIPSPGPGLLLQMMSTSIGREAPAEYAQVFADELRLDEPTPPAAVAPLHTKAIIVGAGFSGLRAAEEFAARGIPYVQLEKSDDVGGVWLTNLYPGAGVDTPSQLYSLSTHSAPWSTTFARQPEVLGYAKTVAEEADLLKHIRFGATVTEAKWDAVATAWTVSVSYADGSAELLSATVLVSAVGTFARATFPQVEGLDEFTGLAIHTAEWPADTVLAGKRVAVIGAGASAMQLVPRIASEVARLTIFQRTPQWIAPVADYFETISDQANDLIDIVPLYREWLRFRLATIWNDGAYPALTVDPDWTDFPLSVNAVNASQRRYYERYLREKLAGRDELIDIATPDYPPFAKRLLLDNGWFDALLLPNVEVVPHGVIALDNDSVVDAEGVSHPADVVVFATGFSAADYLSTLPVVGMDGVRLADVWHGGNAAAYLGMAAPGFPNLFIMYGPNIHPGPGGSYLFMAESTARYIASAIEYLDREGGVLEVAAEVFRTYQDAVDTTNASLVWGTDVVRSYAKNAAGRVVTNFPWRVSEFWLRTHEFIPGDYSRE
jgi:4-hydroxyacetophenone monooxygenase